jgi:hypothetical protein
MRESYWSVVAKLEAAEEMLKEAAYLLEDGLKTKAELSQIEWDMRAQDLIDEVSAHA